MKRRQTDDKDDSTPATSMPRGERIYVGVLWGLIVVSSAVLIYLAYYSWTQVHNAG